MNVRVILARTVALAQMASMATHAVAMLGTQEQIADKNKMVRNLVYWGYSPISLECQTSTSYVEANRGRILTNFRKVIQHT